MSTTRNVAVFVGSLRKESFSRKTRQRAGRAGARVAEAVEIVEIGQLPLYNQDLDADPPTSVGDFRRARRGRRGAVRHAGVQPLGARRAEERDRRRLAPVWARASWTGKPGADHEPSPGAIGGFGANHHLRQSLVFLNVPMMQQPEAYIGNSASLFDDKGNLTNDRRANS